MYFLAYEGNYILIWFGMIFILTGLFAIVSAGFRILGTSIWDDKFSVGPEKKFSLALNLTIFTCIAISILITNKLSTASTERALHIINTSPLITINVRIQNVLTKHRRHSTYYETVLVYRYLNKTYTRTIECDKDEFQPNQSIIITFPAEHPRMLMIDGVLR